MEFRVIAELFMSWSPLKLYIYVTSAPFSYVTLRYRRPLLRYHFDNSAGVVIAGLFSVYILNGNGKGKHLSQVSNALRAVSPLTPV